MTEMENDAAIKMAEEIRADRKRAEYFLLNYAQELTLYHTRREEYVRGERQGSGGNLPGHPTEAEAIRGLCFAETYAAYNWLRAVEFVERGLAERKRMFIAARRKASERKPRRGRRAWLVVTQRLYCEAMRERYLNAEFFVSERTLREMWRYIVDRVLEAYLKIEQKNLNRRV